MLTPRKTLSLLLLSLFLLPLTAQELVVENYEDGIDLWVLLPYELFHFGGDEGDAEYQVSAQIKNSRGKQVAVSEETLEVPKADWLQGTAIPIFGQYELAAGKYKLNLTLRNRKLGDKQNFQRQFSVGTRFTEIGQAYLIAERDGFHYIPGDMDMSELDALRLKLSFAARTELLTIDLDGERYDFHSPESPFELDLKHFAQTDSIAELKLAITEANIRYSLEPLLFGPWFSFNSRYSLKDQLDQLRYVATQNEWRVLRRVPKEKYADAIESFWQANDPTPGTIRNENREYFYQRVLEADERFTIHKRMTGWKSDRGRIYIKFGEPDQIVNDVFPIGRPPSISWHYFRLNRVFVFTDDRGFGQYILRNKDDEYLDF